MRIRVGIGAMVAAGAVVAGAVLAQAFTSLPQLETRLAKAEIPKHGHVAVRAVCPAGTEVLSGGTRVMYFAKPR